MTQRPVKQTESDVQRTVRDFLKAHGWRPVRTQFAFSPGAMSTGEPGMADYLFIYPLRGITRGYATMLGLWIEFKSPSAKLTCRCTIEKKCRLCKQAEWQLKERSKGFVVWSGVDNFDWFEGEYRRHFGWLHAGEQARGQLDLLQEAHA